MAEYIDRLGRMVARDEAFDERGILRDGFGVRPSIFMMDSKPKALMTDAEFAGYRKGVDGFNDWRGGDEVAKPIPNEREQQAREKAKEHIAEVEAAAYARGATNLNAWRAQPVAARAA